VSARHFLKESYADLINVPTNRKRRIKLYCLQKSENLKSSAFKQPIKYYRESLKIMNNESSYQDLSIPLGAHSSVKSLSHEPLLQQLGILLS
jgi:hypothetical protein